MCMASASELALHLWGAILNVDFDFYTYRYIL